MVDQLRAFAAEVTRVAREVGTEGTPRRPGVGRGRPGMWKDLTDNVNFMAVEPHRAGAQHRAGRRPPSRRATSRRRSTVDVKGEIAGAQGHDQHDGRPARRRSPTRSRASPARSASRASSAARRACKGVSGTWKDLTDSVNGLASNLTDQVRNIAEVTTAVAKGDLSQKITVDARGEILQLKNTVNIMVDQLSSFAGELTRVATRGRHRGHARRPGEGRGRLRRLEGPHRQLQPAGRHRSRRRCARSRTCRRR